MSSSSTEDQIPQIILDTRKAASGIPGEQVEPRQTLPTEDMEPDQSKSIPLPPNRQRLIDDVIALYSCQPTVERVARYAPACVYDDQFVYANGKWKSRLLAGSGASLLASALPYRQSAPYRQSGKTLADELAQTATRWLDSGLASPSCSQPARTWATRSSRMTTLSSNSRTSK